MKHAQSYVTVPLLQRFIFCWFHALFLVTTNCKRLKAQSTWAAPTLSPAARLMLPKNFIPILAISVNNSILQFFTFSPLFACTAHLHLLMNLLSWYLFSLQYLLFSQFILSFHTCFATPTLSPQDSRCIFIQFAIHVYEIYATSPLLPKFYITELIPVSPRLSCTAK